MLTLYKVVNEDYESPLAEEEYCLKYEIGKWVEAPHGRLFCFREYKSASRWKEIIFRGNNNCHILKCNAKREETVYETEIAYFTDKDVLRKFYSNDAEDWEKRYIPCKEGMAFPLRIKPIAEME